MLAIYIYKQAAAKLSGAKGRMVLANFKALMMFGRGLKLCILYPRWKTGFILKAEDGCSGGGLQDPAGRKRESVQVEVEPVKCDTNGGTAVFAS